jgi:hypothetical protein
MDDLGRLGSPIDGWFLRENPSINGWFRSSPFQETSKSFPKAPE